MPGNSKKRSCLLPFQPLKGSKRSKLSSHHEDLDFASSGFTMSDIMVDADMKLAYFSAIAAAYEAFASTLQLKMVATVAILDTTTGAAAAPRVLLEPNGTPLGVPSDPNDTLVVANAGTQTETLGLKAGTQTETWNGLNDWKGLNAGTQTESETRNGLNAGTWNGLNLGTRTETLGLTAGTQTETQNGLHARNGLNDRKGLKAGT
jgi:hypothetical protein